jgi:hypothetical protein
MKQRFAPLLCASLAIACASAFGQDADPKVTFRSAATGAKTFLEALSKAVGVPLLTSPQTADEVLMADVRDVPFSVLREKIAEAASAEWQKEGDGYRLIRSQALQNQQERADLNRRAGLLRAEQARLAAELSKIEKLSPDEIQKAAQEQRRQQEELLRAIESGGRPPVLRPNQNVLNADPANRLLMRILSVMDADDLARIAPHSRYVYASLPTRMQKRMPPAADRFLSEFVAQHRAWMAGAPPTPSTGGLSLTTGTQANMQGGLGKVLVILSRNQFGGELLAELRVADQAGNIVAQDSRMLRAGEPAIRGAQARASETAPAVQEDPIPLTQEAREHAAFLAQSPSRDGLFVDVAAPAGRAAPGRMTVAVTAEAAPIGAASGAANRLEVSAAWRAKVLRPDLHDPQAFAASELFLGAARARGKQIVASLPDAALIPLCQRALQPFTPAQLFDLAKTNLGIAVREEGDWMVLRPDFPAEARAVRVNRAMLGRLLTSIQNDSRLTLDNLSRYALSRTNPTPQPAFDGRLVYLLFPQAFRDFSQANVNWRMLQLYAVLSPAQRKLLGDGSVLSLGQLSPQQAALVHGLVYHDMMGPFYRRPQPPGQERRVESRTLIRAAESGQFFSFASPMSATLMDERTEFLPMGVPPQGTLGVAVQIQEAVLASRRDGSAEPRFFSADAYGMYAGLSQNVVVSGPNPSGIPQYDTFRMGVMQTLDFHFQLTELASMDRQLRDTWIEPGAREVPFAALPDGFRQAAEAAMARMKDRGQITIGGPGRQARPPSP